jgi:hypothetical protein
MVMRRAVRYAPAMISARGHLFAASHIDFRHDACAPTVDSQVSERANAPFSK